MSSREELNAGEEEKTMDESPPLLLLLVSSLSAWMAKCPAVNASSDAGTVSTASSFASSPPVSVGATSLSPGLSGSTHQQHCDYWHMASSSSPALGSSEAAVSAAVAGSRGWQLRTTTSFVERPVGFMTSNNRRMFHAPECAYGKNNQPECDVMGQTILKQSNGRPAEDYFYQGVRSGEYGRPPLIDAGVAGSAAAAIVPMTGAQDPSMMLETAGKLGAESMRAALYSNSMLQLANNLYHRYMAQVKQNYGWQPRMTGNIGADNFPLY